MRNLILWICFLHAVLWAQSEPLGPHNVDGHGCAACHIPSVNTAHPRLDAADTFWTSADATLEATTHAIGITQDEPLFHSFMCLTCHDGVIASMSMITRDFDVQKTFTRYDFDRTPRVGGHPVHIPYKPNNGCAIPSDACDPDHWPSRIDPAGVITWTSDSFLQQLADTYGSPAHFYPTAADGGEAMVECSTCHNPHSMLDARVKTGDEVLVRPTHAFLRGWYETEGKNADTVSKFCRSCHYGHAANAFNQKEY